jgi:hypothetical protein
MASAWEGEAPAKPQMSVDAQSHARLCRSFALSFRRIFVLLRVVVDT